MSFVPLSFGKLVLGMPAVQAALSGYSDLPMRLIAREHGADYALNEVVLDELVLRKGKLRNQILAVPEQDHPVGGQLMGSLPLTFGLAAREMVRAGYDVVDINFGCPVNKVLGRCRGGWLLREPCNALVIVDSVLQAVQGDAPVTVKMRRGYDDSAESERCFFEILDGVFLRGVAAVTVHPRSVVQKYVGPSRWEFLARVKRHAGDRTILGSGDLFSPFDVVRMLRETLVDGVTVARGCIGNPFVFGQVRELLAGRTPMRPTAVAQATALRRHIVLQRAHAGNDRDTLSAMRTHAIKYAQYNDDPVAARQRMVSVRSLAELDAAIDAVFAVRDDDRARPLLPQDAVVPSLSVEAG
ncbi:MAG: tRNA-dihydrouridine synthase [Planctomycetota bacterium]|nr:tRNA-dihydrouridine synthase [Planctomycetota bacterium]